MSYDIHVYVHCSTEIEASAIMMPLWAQQESVDSRSPNVILYSRLFEGGWRAEDDYLDDEWHIFFQRWSFAEVISALEDLTWTGRYRNDRSDVRLLVDANDTIETALFVYEGESLIDLAIPGRVWWGNVDQPDFDVIRRAPGPEVEKFDTWVAMHAARQAHEFGGTAEDAQD